MSDLDIIESGDYPEFVVAFEQKMAGKPISEIAREVWRYGNSQYSRGYRQGREDPDFECGPEFESF